MIACRKKMKKSRGWVNLFMKNLSHRYFNKASFLQDFYSKVPFQITPFMYKTDESLYKKHINFMDHSISFHLMLALFYIIYSYAYNSLEFSISLASKKYDFSVIDGWKNMKKSRGWVNLFMKNQSQRFLTKQHFFRIFSKNLQLLNTACM